MSHPRLARLDTVKARVLTRVMTDTCSIVTVQKVSDGKGGFTDSTSSVSSSCSMTTTGSERERVVAEKLEGSTVATLFLPVTATISHSSQVTKNGNTYHVQSLPADDDHTILKEVIVSKKD